MNYPTTFRPATCVCAAVYLASAVHEETCPCYTAEPPLETETTRVINGRVAFRTRNGDWRVIDAHNGLSNIGRAPFATAREAILFMESRPSRRWMCPRCEQVGRYETRFCQNCGTERPINS